jgi:hypothetical protein
MPNTEARRERANWITVEAIRIARRDGRSAAEQFRIYDREIERLVDAEPAYRAAPAAPPAAPAGLLFRF